MSDQWRALDANGFISLLPHPESFDFGGWRCKGGHSEGVGASARSAVSRYAVTVVRDLVEVRGPGELFAHEQVAAERERCARWAEAVHDSAEWDRKNPSTIEASWHFQGVMIGARAIEQGIKEGKSLPPSKATGVRKVKKAAPKRRGKKAV